MKKKIIIAIAAVVVAALFVPVPKTYADGTRSYNALTYKVIKWNRKAENGTPFTRTLIYKMPLNFKSPDELWNEMAIDYVQTGTEITFTAGETESAIYDDISETVTSAADDTDKENTKADMTVKDKTAAPIKNGETKTAVIADTTAEDTYSFDPSDTFHTVRYYSSSELDSYPAVRIINSRQEYNKMLSSVQGLEGSGTEAAALSKKYTDEFFKNASLVAVLTREGSGSVSYKWASVYPSEGEVHICRDVPAVGTCDMAYWIVIKEVEKSNPILKKNPAGIKVKFVDLVHESENYYKSESKSSRVSVAEIRGRKSQQFKNVTVKDAESIRKIIARHSFDSPGYDNISDSIITMDGEIYYYDSSAGIITVKGEKVNSDRAVTLTAGERTELNTILLRYITLT